MDADLTGMVSKVLPEGWTCERYSPAMNHYVVFSPRRYMVTIDFERRCLRTGMSVSGLPMKTRKYAGRGWKEAMVADAVAHLKPIDETPVRLR